jgi:hypothetical protein
MSRRGWAALMVLAAAALRQTAAGDLLPEGWQDRIKLSLATRPGASSWTGFDRPLPRKRDREPLRLLRQPDRPAWRSAPSRAGSTAGDPARGRADSIAPAHRHAGTGAVYFQNTPRRFSRSRSSSSAFSSSVTVA